jgi:hypothetical protein
MINNYLKTVAISEFIIAFNLMTVIKSIEYQEFHTTHFGNQGLCYTDFPRFQNNMGKLEAIIFKLRKVIRKYEKASTLMYFKTSCAYTLKS